MKKEKSAARINIIMISVTLLMVLLFPLSGRVRAENQFNSQGRIIFDNRTGDDVDDVIFDADDFNRLAFTCR